MNHPVENKDNQRPTGGQKPILVQVQILPIKEHWVSALNSKQGIQFQIPWSAALNRFGLEVEQGTHHSQGISVESGEKQWLHSLSGYLLTHLLSSLIIYLNCYSFFITATDTNYYHQVILNFCTVPPEYLHLHPPKVIWEVFIFPAHIHPQLPNTEDGWTDSWMDRQTDIGEIPLSQEQLFLNLSRLASTPIGSFQMGFSAKGGHIATFQSLLY